MRAINHALTGAVIGLTIEQPEVALPLSFISHYFLDSIPHFDPVADKTKRNIASKQFAISLIIDAFLCFALVIVLAIMRPDRWLQAIICAFLAALPDLFSLNHYYKVLKKKDWKPSLYHRFADKIQWFERPSGAIVEIAWATAMIICLAAIIRQ